MVEFDIDDEIKIQIDTGISYLAFLVSAVLIFSLCLKLYFSGASPLDEPLLYGLIAFLAVLAIGALKTSSTTKPGLIIDRNGIIVDAHKKNALRVWWRDIVEFREVSFRANYVTHRYIYVIVRNPKEYHQKLTFFARLWSRAERIMAGSSIIISPSQLVPSFDNVMEILQREFAKYKGVSR
jgi:hypothetical protein